MASLPGLDAVEADESLLAEGIEVPAGVRVSHQRLLVREDSHGHVARVSYRLMLPPTSSPPLPPLPPLLVSGGFSSRVEYYLGSLGPVASIRVVVLVNHRGQGDDVLHDALQPSQPHPDLHAHYSLTPETRVRLGLELSPALTLDDLAEDALAVMDLVAGAHSRFHALGSSFGALVAQFVALAAPERVLSLSLHSAFTDWRATIEAHHPPQMVAMLLNPWVVPPASVPPSHMSEAERQSRAQLQSMYGEGQAASPLFSAYAHAESRPIPQLLARWMRRYPASFHALASLQPLLARCPTAPRLRAQPPPLTAVPVLLVHGSMDALLPLAVAEDTQRLLPHARLHVLEGANHAMGQGEWEEALSAMSALWKRAEAEAKAGAPASGSA